VGIYKIVGIVFIEVWSFIFKSLRKEGVIDFMMVRLLTILKILFTLKLKILL